MTWGDIQLLAVQKMFLNTNIITVDDLVTMRTDKKYATYLNAMPMTANECIRIMLTRGKPYIKMYNLTTENVDATLTDDNNYCFDLQNLLPDYRSVTNMFSGTKESHDYILRFNRYLYVPRHIIDNGNIQLGYASYPEPLSALTADNYKIDLPIDMINIIPLYLAGELYKDDDVSLATMYRNEFEAELEAMTHDNNYEEFTSVNGWL